MAFYLLNTILSLFLLRTCRSLILCENTVVPSSATNFGVLQTLLFAAPPQDEQEEDLDFEAFQARRQEGRLNNKKDFDGYALRDLIVEKWGEQYDVDFNRVDSFGFREIYLNVFPFKLGGRRCRHKSELDYLMHLQAVVEILQKYKQLDYITSQIDETDKVPKMGAPIKAVPLRLKLTKEEINSIMGY